jgi:hypothetical protein
MHTPASPGAYVGPRPSVRIGDLQVSGAMSGAAVRGGVARKVNYVRYCYERELANNPLLQGTALLSFVINADGSVHDIHVDVGDMSWPALGECIASAAQHWEFPINPGGEVTTVSAVPYELSQH